MLRFRPACLLLLLLVALAGCRLDVAVELSFGADGTGEIVVTATADADVLARAPGLAEDLRFADVRRTGWAVDGPTPTEDGGLTVVLRHGVTSAADATNLLASLGPPFQDVTLRRVTAGDETTVRLTGRLRLAGGFAAFADADLLDAVGGTPFADDLAEAGAAPSESLSFLLRAELPGEVESTNGAAVDGGLEWEAPLDGRAQEVDATTVQRPATGGTWARPLSWLALVLLVAWIALAGTVLVLVARARRARARARRALAHLARRG